MQQSRRCVGLTVVLTGLLACGNGIRGGGTGNTPVVTISKTTGGSGDAQTASVATVLPLPLRVLVLEDGSPKLGVEVTWSVVAGGGSITTIDTTDATGAASATWTLGTIGGTQLAQASAGSITGSPVSFSATATPGAPATIAKTAGDNQITVVRGLFPIPLKVKVTDQYANPVPGVTVTWDPTGSVTVPSSSTTDNKGEALASARGGNLAGSPTVLATVNGVASNPTFALTVLPVARQVSVGSNFFTSGANGSSNPAVDTIAVGETLLWALVGGTHRIRSVGSPSFTNQASNLDSEGYFFTFTSAGTYQYDCAIHGAALMSGTLVVQ